MFKAQVVNGGSMSEDSGGLRSLGNPVLSHSVKEHVPHVIHLEVFKVQKVWSVMGMVGRNNSES